MFLKSAGRFIKMVSKRKENKKVRDTTINNLNFVPATNNNAMKLKELS